MTSIQRLSLDGTYCSTAGPSASQPPDSPVRNITDAPLQRRRACGPERGMRLPPQRMVSSEAGRRPRGAESQSRAPCPQHTPSSLPQFSMTAEGIPRIICTEMFQVRGGGGPVLSQRQRRESKAGFEFAPYGGACGRRCPGSPLSEPTCSEGPCAPTRPRVRGGQSSTLTLPPLPQASQGWWT